MAMLLTPDTDHRTQGWITVAKKNPPLLLFSIAIALLHFLPLASAADISYELRVGVGHTDNVRRVDINEEDQTIATAGLSLNVSGESLRSEGELTADLDYQEFLDDAFDSELQPRIEGDLTLKARPDRLHWVATGRYGQARQNPFEASTPDNREEVGYLSTGPDFILPIGGRILLQLNGRLATTFFEDSDTDSNSLSGGLSLVRAISSNRSVSLNGTGERVEFDVAEGQLTDFERYSAFLGFDSEISKGTLSAKLGSNEVHVDGEIFQGTLASLSWNRQISAILSISVSARQSYTDAGDSFGGGLDAIFRPGSESSIVPVRDPFETQEIAVGYAYAKGRVSMSFNLSASEDEYESASSFDSQRLNGTASGGVELASGWAVGLRVQYEERDFQTIDRTDEYLTTVLGLDKALSRTLALGFEYRLNDRSSNADGEDYAENQFSVQLKYSPQSQR